ncbi:MAG: hypothetical protein ACW97P_05330 [Candidatus Hodarchaeales archaeon]|jgi:hypothetical protein
MTNLFLLPKILHELVNTLENFIDTLFTDRKVTLPVKIRSNTHNSIVTWNIFPNGQVDLVKIFKDLNKIIYSKLVGIPKSELLSYTIDKGRILDTMVEAFFIKHGCNYDLYIYDSELFVYTRLLLESPSDDQSKEWISIDIDVIKKSAWFLD